MGTQWFCINDFDDFIDSARRLVFKFFGQANEMGEDSLVSVLSHMSKEEIEELDTTLSYEESVVIVKQHARKKVNRKTKIEKYYITDKILTLIIEELNARMISNIISKLVNQGVLDTAYDSEINDFVFWVKDDENNNSRKEKPETD